MKKIISAGLALSLLLPAAGVFAEETQPVSSDITMLYNNTVLGSDEFVPFIHEDRTMLPFRFLLEEIGAVVNYDDPTRTVSAEKDGISISFSLDDTYIDITKNAATERIIQDVENILKNDRVYVPIRFMSEAFGLSVGWDAENRTAIVVDYGRYADTLREEAPDLIRYLELSSRYTESYSQAVNLTLDYNSNTGDEVKLDFTTASDLSVNGDGVVTENLADIDTNMLNEKIGTTLPPLEDIRFTIAYKDGMFYAKTDAIDRMKEIAPNNETVNNISLFISSGTWFKADFDELCTELGLSSGLKAAVKTALVGSEKFDIEALCNAASSKGLTSVTQAAAIDAAFSISGKIFNNAIVITDNGNGSYDMSISLPETNLIENKNNLLTEEELNTLKSVFAECTFAASSKVKLENDLVTASESMLKLTADGPELTCSIDADSVLTPNTSKDIPKPSSAIDIVTILQFLGL